MTCLSLPYIPHISHLSLYKIPCVVSTFVSIGIVLVQLSFSLWTMAIKLCSAPLALDIGHANWESGLKIYVKPEFL